MSFGDYGLQSIRRAGGDRAIVFVHGFGGHPIRSWGEFPAVLRSDADLKDWDILTLGYDTGTTLPVLSEWLSTELMRTGVQQIALIAHGTGALVAQRALIDHRELTARVTHAFFFASPNRGMRFPVPNPLLKVIQFAAGFRQLQDVSPSSSFLVELNKQWAETFGRTAPFSYWSIAGAQDTIVLFESLTATPAAHRLVIPGTHVSLVKPTSATDPAVQIVRDGLLKHTVPESAKRDAGAAAVLEKKVEEDLFDVYLHHDAVDRVDREEVRELALRLNHEGIRTWLLEDVSPAGRKWQDVLSKSIAHIRSVAICIGRLGPARLATQRDEVARMFAEKDLPVIPVFLSRSPADSVELSDTLSAYIPVDFRGSESDAPRNLMAGIRGERPQRAIQKPSSSSDRSRRGAGKRWKAIAAAIVVLITIIVAWSAFRSADSSLPQQILDARKANVTPPQFLKPENEKNAPSVPNATLLLFIHGVFGDTVGTWRRNEQTDSLPSLILSREEFSQGHDAFAFGYPSAMVKLGSFQIPQAATALATEIRYRNFLSKYSRIVLIAHSMGGLVALEMLTTNPDIRAHVPLVVTFATPYDGAQVAILGDKVLENPALAGMLPRDENNSFLSSLAYRWKRSRSGAEPKTIVRCAYENVPVPGIGIVVAEPSASALCDDVADPIADDHLGLIKPDGPQHQSVKILTNALRSLPQSSATPPVVEPAPPLDLGALMPGCVCKGTVERGSCVCETPGTFTWNRPASIDTMTLTACGGGGGGGQAGGAGHGGNDNAGGGGGGEGAPIYELMITELTAPRYSVVVGKGGEGGKGAGAIDGKDGEPSSFGAQTASFRITARPNSPTTLPFTDYLEFPGGSGGKRGGHAFEGRGGRGGNDSHGAAGGNGRGPVNDFATASDNGQQSRFQLGGKGTVNCDVVGGSGGSGGGGGGSWGPGGNGGCGGAAGYAKPGGHGRRCAGGGGGGAYGQDNRVGEAGGNGGRGHVIIQWGS